MYTLYLGNKSYSSWSLRAWLLLKHFGIPFREQMVLVAGRDFNASLKPLAGKAATHASAMQESEAHPHYDQLAAAYGGPR